MNGQLEEPRRVGASDATVPRTCQSDSPGARSAIGRGCGMAAAGAGRGERGWREGGEGGGGPGERNGGEMISAHEAGV